MIYRLLLAAILILTEHYSRCEPATSPGCKPPTSQELTDATSYISKKYHVAPSDPLQITSSGKADDECFWRIVFTQQGAKRDFTYIYTPDRKHLVSSMFDLRIDPLLEETRLRNATARELVSGSPMSKGSANPMVTIVEFSDFQCPFCRQMTEILNQDRFAKDPNLRIIFRNFPLTNIHPWAKSAAALATCAGLQNEASFWKIHDFLFENQKTIKLDTVQASVMSYVQTQPNISAAQFQDCLDKDLTLGMLMKDQELAKKLSVRATPTLYVNGERFEGFKDAAQLEAIVKTAKGEASATNSVSKTQE